MAGKTERTLTPGIIYLGRVPPFIKPEKVRHIFSAYGEVGRIYLQPEEDRLRRARSKEGGSRKIRYTEGWIEFKDKRIAKRVAAALNNTQIGGKKRSRFYDDLWNLKYLPKFFWSHLSEKMRFQNAVANKKQRIVLSQLKKETEFYKDNLDKSKALAAMSGRKRKRAQAEDEAVAAESSKAATSPGSEEITAVSSSKAWNYKQVAPAAKRPKIALPKIFG